MPPLAPLPQPGHALPPIDAVMRATQPLWGMTILAVEDSRFASEALRLLARKSGARLQRAATLRLARKQLQYHPPEVVIIDIGLPDGSGCELISELAACAEEGPLVLAMSGDPALAAAGLAAGAVGFLEKPVESLALFQSTILRHIHRPNISFTEISLPSRPDPQALRDDLVLAAGLLERASPDELPYIVTFLRGLGRASRDEALEALALRIGPLHHDQSDLQALRHAVQDRLQWMPSWNSYAAPLPDPDIDSTAPPENTATGHGIYRSGHYPFLK